MKNIIIKTVCRLFISDFISVYKLLSTMDQLNHIIIILSGTQYEKQEIYFQIIFHSFIPVYFQLEDLYQDRMKIFLRMQPSIFLGWERKLRTVGLTTISPG